jgi:hypothetical protein
LKAFEYIKGIKYKYQSGAPAPPPIFTSILPSGESFKNLLPQQATWSLATNGHISTMLSDKNCSAHCHGTVTYLLTGSTYFPNKSINISPTTVWPN